MQHRALPALAILAIPTGPFPTAKLRKQSKPKLHPHTRMHPRPIAVPGEGWREESSSHAAVSISLQVLFCTKSQTASLCNETDGKKLQCQNPFREGRCKRAPVPTSQRAGSPSNAGASMGWETLPRHRAGEHSTQKQAKPQSPSIVRAVQGMGADPQVAQRCHLTPGTPGITQTPHKPQPTKNHRSTAWFGRERTSNSPQLQGPAVGRLPPTGSGCPGPHPTRLSSASPARGELRVWALGAQPNPQRWVGVRKAEKPTGMEEEETSSSRGGIRFPSSAGTARPRQATKRLHARSPGSVSRGARHQRGRRRPNAGYGTSPGRPGNASGCNAAAPQRDEPRTEPEPPRSGTPQPVSPFRSSGKGHRERTTKAAELRNSKSAPRGGKKEYRIKMKEPKKKPSPQPGCTHPPPAEGAPCPRRALPVRRAATRRGPCAAAQLGSAQRGTAGSGAAAAAGRGAVHKSGRKR